MSFEEGVLQMTPTPREEELKHHRNSSTGGDVTTAMTTYYEKCAIYGFLPGPDRAGWRWWHTTTCSLCSGSRSLNPDSLCAGPSGLKRFRPEELEYFRGLGKRPGPWGGLPYEWCRCPRCGGSGTQEEFQSHEPYNFLTVDRVGAMDPSQRETAHQLGLELAWRLGLETDWVAWGSGWAYDKTEVYANYPRSDRMLDRFRSVTTPLGSGHPFPSWVYKRASGTYADPTGRLVEAFGLLGEEIQPLVRELLWLGVDPYTEVEGHLGLMVPYPICL